MYHSNAEKSIAVFLFGVICLLGVLLNLPPKSACLRDGEPVPYNISSVMHTKLHFSH